MSMNKTPWCIDPFMTISVSSEGRYKLCCQSNILDGHNINNMSLNDFFSSEYMHNIRKEMLDDELSPRIKKICASCIREEEKGLISRRIKNNEEYGKSRDGVKSVRTFIDNNYQSYDIVNIKYMSLNMLGNLCNYKCIMCYPVSSSRIASENIVNGIDSTKKALVLPYNTEFSKKVFFEDLFDVFSNIKSICFYGGELLINPEFEDIFSRLAKLHNAKNIHVTIITNASVVQDYILKYKDSFKSFLLLVSLDGIDKRGEYIRYGKKWKIFDSNIDTFIQNGITVNYNIAIQMLNIGYIDEIYSYILHKQKIQKYTVNFCYVNFPYQLDAINLPRKIKNQYIEKLSKDVNFDKYKDNIMPILEKDGDHQKFIMGINKLKSFDKIRKTNFSDIFPEFKEYL